MTILTHPRTASPRTQALTAAPRRVERAAPATGSIDPIRVLRRYLWAIVAAVVVGGIIGVAGFFVLRELYPRYSDSVVFEVRPGLQSSTDVGTLDTTSDDMVFRIAQTETYILTSREVLEKALSNFDVQKTDWAKQFYVGGTFSISNALDDLEDDISTSVRRSSNLFTLHWSAVRPTDVPVVLNAVAQAYMTNRKQRDFEVHDKNIQLFNNQLAETQRELAAVDGDIKKLIAESGLTTMDDNRWSAQFYQMQELVTEGTRMATQLNVARSGLALVRQQIEGRVEPNPEDRARAENDRSLDNFTQTVRYQKAEYRSLLETRKGDNQMLLEAERRVRSAEAELDARVHEVMIRNLQAEATELEQAVVQLEGALEANNKERERVGAMLEELTGNQSTLEALRSQREYLQEQRKTDMELIKEATIMRMRLDAARIAMAQPAYTPREPSFPRPAVIIPLGVLAMTALTVGLIFLRELVDQRVKSASDLALLPGVRVLGSLPESGDDPTRITAPQLVVRRQPTSVLAESYRQAATAILPELDEAEAQTLLLVSGLPEAGTTTVASNLAAAAAATGRSVLLIDANFRRPGLGSIMGIGDDAVGLGDVLNSPAALDEAIHDGGDGVSVMPVGTPANRVFERLNNGVIDGVLADLRTRFDLIIFDVPPAVVAGDAMMLANKVDAAVLVVRANQEHRGLVARMINRLADTRCQLIGVLLNRPRGIAGGYLKKNYAAMAEYSRNGAAS